MSHLQYFTYSGFGERVLTETHYSQAVLVNNTIHISGQGGWDRQTEIIPEDRNLEIDATFDNIAHALAQAGADMANVYKLKIYLAPWADDAAGRIVENLRKWFPGHRPVLTVLGVERLYGDMTVEIEVEAHLNK